MSGVFICYRRLDSQGFAGRLGDDLIELLGESNVFRDDEIEAGDDYTDVLKRSVARCSVLLVVIGKGWLAARNSDGSRRLDNPEDWVRVEVESGLERDMLVVPVLVGGAQMPAEPELPRSLGDLSRRQAFVMSDRRWEEDLQALVSVLSDYDPRLSPFEPEFESGGQLRDQVPPGRPVWSVRLIRWLKKLLWAAVLLLVGYFVLETYVEPQMREAIYKFVDDFVVFVIERSRPWLDKLRALSG